jgi:hypothetical protein
VLDRKSFFAVFYRRLTMMQDAIADGPAIAIDSIVFYSRQFLRSVSIDNG